MPVLLVGGDKLEYKLNITGQTYSVETTRSDETGAFLASSGAKERRVVAKAVSHEQLRLEVDGMPLNLFLAETIDGVWFWIDGRARFAQNADQLRRRTSRRPGEIPGQVTPPTPATVMRVLAQVGARVERGAPLVVVSAMKMEITLSAPYAGIVKTVNTQVAAQVSPGEILVEIEPEPEEQTDE
jgi:biotin carboxyl carrier protein